MEHAPQATIYNQKLSKAEFERLSRYIHQEYGIKLAPVKQVMLQGRLIKRLNALGIPTFKDYIDFVFSPEGKQSELIHMIDVVTTNKTDFFREANHFDFLRSHILPEFASRKTVIHPLQVWNAGCSSGEEPYTTAIVLQEYYAQHHQPDYNILATDLSTDVLEKARKGIYPEQRIAVVPMSLKKKYFLRSKDSSRKLVRVVPELRKKVKFGRLNFMSANYAVETRMDVIFCRNVLIYFDKATQEKVINKLCQNLKKGGYFFLGHSESITNMNVPLEQIVPTVFRRT